MEHSTNKALRIAVDKRGNSRSCIVLVGMFFLVLPAGCASYRSMPLTQDTLERALAVPGNEEIRIRASAIKHPILKPVPFDERDGLSPDEAAILAVIANPSLKVARDAKGLTAAQLLQAGILPNPRVSYSLETPVGGDMPDKVNAFDLGLGWDVTSLVARSSNMKAARYHATSVDLAVAWKEWQVAEAAKLHVYRLLIAEKQLTFAEAMKRGCKRAFDAAERGITLGVVTASRLSFARTNLEKGILDVLQAQLEVNIARIELKHVLGLPSDSTLQVEKNVSPIKARDIPPIQKLTNNIEKRRLDLLAFRHGYESQEARLRAAIRDQFPKIKVGLTGARDTDGIQTVGAGISISIPIFDRNQGRIAVERATRKQLFDEYASRLFEARAEIARIVEELHSTSKQLDNVEKSIKDLEELAERYDKAVGQGRADIFDYCQAVLRLYAKRIDKLALERRLSDLAIGLEIASGMYIFTGSECTQGDSKAAGGFP